MNSSIGKTPSIPPSSGLQRQNEGEQENRRQSLPSENADAASVKHNAPMIPPLPPPQIKEESIERKPRFTAPAAPPPPPPVPQSIFVVPEQIVPSEIQNDDGQVDVALSFLDQKIEVGVGAFSPMLAHSAENQALVDLSNALFRMMADKVPSSEEEVALFLTILSQFETLSSGDELSADKVTQALDAIDNNGGKELAKLMVFETEAAPCQNQLID